MSIINSIASLTEKKAKLNITSLAILSFFGGAYIAFGGLLALLISGNLPTLASENPGFVKFIFGAVFPLGLILVVIAGAELFTGNNSYFSAGVLAKKVSVSDLLKNWGLVFVFNFVGALFVAYFLTHLAELLNTNQTNFIIKIGESKANLAFNVAFLRALGCNWLVCLALWMAVKANTISGKILAIWFPIMAFVAIGFEHSIANQFFVPLAIFSGANISWSQFLVNNLLPVTLGNIVGGGIFVGMAYFFTESKSS